MRIKNLEGLLSEKLGKNKTIVNVEEIDFLGKGENYGSSLFRVDVTVKDEHTGEEEVISTVAKTLPESEQQKKLFNVQVTVGKEIAFYNKIVPRLKEFLQESGVDIDFDFFPVLHAGRFNLDGSDKVDEDSVILLENLKASGFVNVSRYEGFDYESAKIVLKDLAAFHAVTLALKLKKPEVFEKEIKIHCIDVFGEGGGNDPPPPPPEDGGHNVLMEIIYQNDKCLPQATKLMEKFKQFAKPPDSDKPRGPPRPTDSPWHAVAHCDLWVNNLMIKFENGKPTKNKFVDFQGYCYNSCLADLIFFMWSSIQKSVLDESYDDLIKYYHNIFYDILSKSGCDTKMFTFDMFTEEIDRIAKDEIMHVLFFLMIIFGPKEGYPADSFMNFKGLLVDLSVSCKEKIWFCVQEAGRRNWL